MRRIDPAGDSESLHACYQIYLAAMAVDDPSGPVMSRPSFMGWLVLGWTEDPSETWLATDEHGSAIGWYLLGLPQRENRTLAPVSVFVPPARRRAGVGTRLLGHAAARARQDGRSVLSGDARDGTAGVEFARAAGARQGGTELRQVLRLDAIPAGRLAALRAEAEPAARGYSILSWLGLVPADELAAVAAVTRAVADMPHDAGHEAQLWDADRVHRAGRRVTMQGLRYYTVAARSDAARSDAARSVATGELVALSQLGVDPLNSTWGIQELTAVARPHRGHRLGLLLKLVMLDLLAEREPRLTRILTGNGDDNKHMISINVAIGFELLDRWLSWEVDAGQVP
ncbi:MAG TPA: GNAT family N-acetyltransferase [Streptosporangiaceae bacterium]|nr:GNAT family N-acetyltransferase [Streptosporangiaceae bacterium]